MTEDEMAGWHHGLSGHEFEQTPALRPCSDSQSCLTLCNPMDCSLQDSSVLEIFQARVAISFSNASK